MTRRAPWLPEPDPLAAHRKKRDDGRRRRAQLEARRKFGKRAGQAKRLRRSDP